jgi:hypothetical protein
MRMNDYRTCKAQETPLPEADDNNDDDDDDDDNNDNNLPSCL